MLFAHPLLQLHTDTDNDKCTFSEASFASHVHAIASTTYPVESQGGWSIMCDAAAGLSRGLLLVLLFADTHS